MEEIEQDTRDEEIALLIQNGDSEKFGILMERYEKKLSRYGRKFLARRESIEDIVQDVFISTFQNIQSFDTSMKFSSWNYRIAHNNFVNELKKNSKNAIIPSVDLDTILAYQIYEDPDVKERENRELKKIIDTSLDKLKPKYKEIVILHFIEELSYKEISDILKIPTGTVGIRLKRAKEMLREVYKEIDQ